MLYTNEKFPEPMRNLNPRVRRRAISILNNIIEEKNTGLDNAINTSIQKAKYWAEIHGFETSSDFDVDQSQKNNLYVYPHDKGWAVKSEQNTRASYIFRKKIHAIERARELAAEYQTNLIIQGDKGEIQQEFYFNNQGLH